MRVYYNEFEPYAAEWLRNLIKAELIPAGEVDTRSIVEVQPDDLKGYDQCHFFAGIGGWSVALGLAKWSDDRPVWTGSCPCQSYSAAGQQKGRQDERHLWPTWFNLIRECNPPTIFGEQVASAITHGWLDEVFHDLENEAYSCAAAVLPACSVGAPHKRDRLWFVAHTDSKSFTQPVQSEVDVLGYGQTSKAQWRQNRFIPEMASFCREILKKGLDKSKNDLLVDGVQLWAPQGRAYGNAIVPKVAAEFIQAYRECVAWPPPSHTRRQNERP